MGRWRSSQEKTGRTGSSVVYLKDGWRLGSTLKIFELWICGRLCSEGHDICCVSLIKTCPLTYALTTRTDAVSSVAEPGASIAEARASLC